MADYVAGGGGRALELAGRVEPDALVRAIGAAGLRGRGGAGFPTGEKWRTVAANRSSELPTTVVVNGAEGEPGSFKDRTILRTNPFAVLEGALIAARAVGADEVVVAVKHRFTRERQLLDDVIGQMKDAGWSDGVRIDVATGPSEYLLGEETALLEVLDGRPPFPRVAPPFRHGVDEVGDGGESAAAVALAGEGAAVAPPTLVDNVETLANVPGIVANGPEWFREIGTDASPGTVTCTVSGATDHDGVVEVPMGTSLSRVLDRFGVDLGEVSAVLPGVSAALLPAGSLDTPLTYEAMAAVGSGLGCGAFTVFGSDTPPLAIAAGVARFLAVESCGQCTPCKDDGRVIADELALALDEPVADVDRLLTDVADHLDTIAVGARCSLASQHQQIVGSVLANFGEQVRADLTASGPIEPVTIAAIDDIVDGRVVLDEGQMSKQPDWTHHDEDSGQSPADRINTRAAAR
jgi:NADH:ubiquinone oxidoreductase subunit F (NADH-binding)